MGGIRGRLSSYRKFIFLYFKSPLKVGSLAPSSQQLSKMITEMADLPSKSCVVELGPGTGVFTEKILEKLSPQSCFFCLEINSHFVEETRKRCPQAVVYNSSAEKILDCLALHQRKSCDTVISSIPWTIFDDQTQNTLLDTIYEALEPGGEFLTYVYLSGMYLPGGIRILKKIDKKFNSVDRSKVIWKNFPPVYVYRCRKHRK